MKAFVSYSWDSEDHRQWVRQFADTLIRAGIEVILDQYDLPLGGDRFAFMERGIRDAECVLCVCTPEYVKRANSRTRGVGQETMIITPYFYEDQSAKEFIPIVRHACDDIPPTPDYMASRIFVDFSDDRSFSDQMEHLLRQLHQQPQHRKPPLGRMPDFARPGIPIDVVGNVAPEELYDQLKRMLPVGWADPEFLLNYGRLCFHLRRDEDAKLAFNRVLELDQQYTSFADINDKVRQLAKANEPFELEAASRKAMMYLGLITQDDDYVLNSAYSAADPEVLVMAGKFYLSIYDADIPTAVSYFIRATEGMRPDSPGVKECDSALYAILMERRAWYPRISWDFIKKCVTKWNEHKVSLM